MFSIRLLFNYLLIKNKKYFLFFIYYNIMNNLVKFAIYSSIENMSEKDNINKRQLYSLINNNSFGAFVTVERSVYQQISRWPVNIHGCIGNWDNKYKKKSKNDIISIISGVSYSAAHNDNRKIILKNHIH